MTIRVAPAASRGKHAVAEHAHHHDEGQEERPDRLDCVLAGFRRPCGGGGEGHRSRLAGDDLRHLLSSLSSQAFTQRLRACGPTVIRASGRLSPRLTELAEFLLTAITLGDQPFCACKDSARERWREVRRTLRNGSELRADGTAQCARSPLLAPLFLGGATPDASVSVVQRPSQAWPADRACSAYPLGLFDLRDGSTYNAERKEQFGVRVATSGVVTPVHICGVSSPLEKVLARDAHRGPPPFLPEG